MFVDSSKKSINVINCKRFTNFYLPSTENHSKNEAKGPGSFCHVWLKQCSLWFSYSSQLKVLNNFSTFCSSMGFEVAFLLEALLLHALQNIRTFLSAQKVNLRVDAINLIAIRNRQIKRTLDINALVR